MRLAEDILKILYHSEAGNNPVRIEQLNDVFADRSPTLSQALDHLRAEGLITQSDAPLKLTNAGRSRGLELIRAHRLLESQLANQRTRTVDLHKKAEILEHELTVAEIEAIADALNHPRFDPHGDPIPSKYGRLPELKRSPLQDWTTKSECLIAHIEDEPADDFAKIEALKIAPGMRLRVMEKSENSLQVSLDGRNLAIPSDLIPLIAVEPLKPGDKPLGEVDLLTNLKKHEEATIVGISAWVRGPERSRMLNLGIVPGTLIKSALVGAFESPVAYHIRGTEIALRREQASHVMIRKISQGETNE